MKSNKYVYAGIGAAAVVAVIIAVSYSMTQIPSVPKIDPLELDFTYDEANSVLKSNLQLEGISMSSPLKFAEQQSIERYCSFFSDPEKQKLVEYCTSTELKDGNGNFLGNVHMTGSHDAPRLVFVVVQSNPMIDNLEQVKKVFDISTKELVCDCWNEEKPGGYETIGIWVDALRDFHTGGDKPHSSSKPLLLASKQLKIELTTTEDGYVWELLISQWPKILPT